MSNGNASAITFWRSALSIDDRSQAYCDAPDSGSGSAEIGDQAQDSDVLSGRHDDGVR
ncbi:hypothetical protein BDS110ZK19_83070 [Bradyrhizobium diazoefficiens]